MKKEFYVQLQMVVDSCPKGGTLIVLCDFNATAPTVMAMTLVLILTVVDQEMEVPQCFF